ncbi:MAG: glycosyltransferase [Rudaea sp.]
MTDTAILGPGGSERFLRNLLLRLPAERYSIDVLQLVSEPAGDERIAALSAPGVRLLYRPIGASYGLRGLRALVHVRGRVKRREYDVVQSQHEKSDLINAFLPRHANVMRISNRRDMGFQKSALLRTLFRRINSRFDRIVAPTPHIIDALVAEENANRAICAAIANGVDTQRFEPATASRCARLRSDLQIPADALAIGCVASFTPVKRHVDLIAAFAIAQKAHPNAQLLLIGEGPLRAEIEAQVDALGIGQRVRLLGARSDVENILPALDIFALASRTEGMSNAILEAQACGVAVVATAVGGNLDLVEPQCTGLLAPPLAAAEFADALSRLLTDGAARTRMGNAARARIERAHSLDAMAAAYDDLYRSVAHVV